MRVRLTTRDELKGTVDEVYALLTDPGFQEAKCVATTDDSHQFTVDVTGSAGTARVRTERHLPSETLPDVAKSFVGEMRAMLALFQPAKPLIVPKGIESS